MAIESKSYSKGRGLPQLFFGDSEDKDGRATELIQKYSNSILLPTYLKMAAVSTNGLKSIAPLLFDKIVIRDGEGNAMTVNWKSLKDIPITAANAAVPISMRGTLRETIA